MLAIAPTGPTHRLPSRERCLPRGWWNAAQGQPHEDVPQLQKQPDHAL